MIRTSHIRASWKQLAVPKAGNLSFLCAHRDSCGECASDLDTTPIARAASWILCSGRLKTRTLGSNTEAESGAEPWGHPQDGGRDGREGDTTTFPALELRALQGSKWHCSHH